MSFLKTSLAALIMTNNMEKLPERSRKGSLTESFIVPNNLSVIYLFIKHGPPIPSKP